MLRCLQRHARQNPPARPECAREHEEGEYQGVEIRAKLPTGDWLWPALWMLPVDDA
ncbi:hypothetical protein C8J57DRAFT_1335137 [Mycena rebaudengoi]|nr:hypothetical protein C8J57DRAFT_1335137 [Mycena rebaudengoi]